MSTQECPCRRCTPETGRGPGCHTPDCPNGWYERLDLDAAGAACRNAEHELEDLTEQLRSLRFRREHFDLRSGYGPAFTSLTLALHHLDYAKDDLREAADGFYAADPDVSWIDADGRTHYYEEEKP